MADQNEHDAMKARIAELEAELVDRKKAANTMIYFRVGDKGGVSAYGLGRFPVTLYAEQWDRLLSRADALKDFMTANVDKLKFKPAK